MDPLDIPSPFSTRQDDDQLPIAMNMVQLILAEKRTALSLMRTGISVFALPLSVFSVLIATSKHYDLAGVFYLFIPLFLINTALIVLGAYLIIKALRKIQTFDKMIDELKEKNHALSPFLE
jgi:hypothetical protein